MNIDLRKVKIHDLYRDIGDDDEPIKHLFVYINSLLSNQYKHILKKSGNIYYSDTVKTKYLIFYSVDVVYYNVDICSSIMKFGCDITLRVIYLGIFLI